MNNSVVINWPRNVRPQKDDVRSDIAKRLELPESVISIERTSTFTHRITDLVTVETNTIPKDRILEVAKETRLEIQ